MSHTINSLRENNYNRIADVYEIFWNFFGEQFTDVELSQGRANIYVYWPRVTVTNENDRSVTIEDLYAKVQITEEGTIPYENRGFQLVRSTFPEIQFASGYLHSHIPRFSGVPHFQNPCLGSGPINRTIADLKNEYEEALWMLFCQELSLYVTVESLSGGPYLRMENIGQRGKLYNFDGYNDNDDMSSSFWQCREDKKVLFMQIINTFTKYYLEHGHLSLSFVNGGFVPGMTYFDFMIDISNSFIDYYNKFGQRDNVQELYNRSIIVECLAADGSFFENDENLSNHDYSQYEGQKVLEFKDHDILLHIEQATGEQHTEVTLLLHHQIAMHILHNILRIINYRYRNEHTTNNRGSNGKTLTSTYQTVCYL